MHHLVQLVAHNTLIGCLRCQKRCPANKDVTDDVEMLAEINEAETRMILLNKPEKKLFESVKRKLKRVDGADDLAYLSRNLNLVLQDP
jgi:epoxyqueuosine reductase